MFEPGQRVACVNDQFPPDIRDYYNALPVKDRVYTVRDVVPGIQWDLKETAAVYLAELVNLPNARGTEPGFGVWRFRELLETEGHSEETVAEPETVGADLVEAGT